MGEAAFTLGLHEIGDGCWAYLQPDGSWGWSNAGLVTDRDASLLVDTLFDVRLTRDMLDAMRRATPAAQTIDTLVNTHANGDHCYGNQLVAGADIIASKASAAEMDELSPERMARFIENAEQLGAAGTYLKRIFGDFDFRGIEFTPPTETFEGELVRRVGDKDVHLIEVGPAHTRGDVLAWVPSERAVFTGDILFIDGTPIIWEGPVANWIRACDRIAALDAAAIVPGHGPLTDRAGVQAVRDYLVFVRDAARQRFDADMSPADAARDIELGAYADWLDSERIAVNVYTLYREFSGGALPRPGTAELWGLMAELA